MGKNEYFSCSILPYGVTSPYTAPNANTVQLRMSAFRRALRRSMPTDDVDGPIRIARGVRLSRPQWEVTHLALDAARDDAPATGADAHRAQFRQNVLACAVLASHGPRGESPPHAAACGG